jgi:hypothetical protein
MVASGSRRVATKVKCVCSFLHARTHIKQKKKKITPVIRVDVITRRTLQSLWFHWYIMDCWKNI